MNPRGIPYSLGSSCDTVDCVVQEMDHLTTEGNRFKIMEGYEDTNLYKMLQDSRLTIETINPFFPVFGIYGYITFQPGKYGEIYKCAIKYTPGFNWLFLKHELAHCQGYSEVGYLNLSWFLDDYTHNQKEILKLEGKDKWIDTEFYKQKKYMTKNYIHQ